MKRAEYIQEELNELGAKILMETPSTMPYSLPINYFSTLNQEIIDVVVINEMTEAKPDWGNKMPFEIPNKAYFEELSAQILIKVNTEAEWNKTNPFAVPQGYFENLPETIVSKAKAETPKANKRVPLFRTFQLAASMALIFFAGFTVMKMSTFKAPQKANSSVVSQADISNYVNENLDDFDTDLIINGLAATDTKIDNTIDISDAEIKAYLDETGWN